MKVIIDPEDDIQYMSFYIKGLIDRFGRSHVVYNRRAFHELSDDDRATRTMRFIIKDGSHEKRQPSQWIISSIWSCRRRMALWLMNQLGLDPFDLSGRRSLLVSSPVNLSLLILLVSGLPYPNSMVGTHNSPLI